MQGFTAGFPPIEGVMLQLAKQKEGAQDWAHLTTSSFSSPAQENEVIVWANEVFEHITQVENMEFHP